LLASGFFFTPLYVILEGTKDETKKNKYMFGFSHPTFLGIDFGTASIKAIELREKGGVVELVNFAQVSLENLRKRELAEGESYDGFFVQYLKALLHKMNPETNGAYLAIPAFIGLISLVDFPEMTDEELQEAVQYEAKRFIPAKLEDIALSWDIVGTSQAQDGSVRQEVLVVAALKQEVLRYQGYAQKSDLEMKFLELETFSLARAAVGEQQELVLLIDMGARATNLLLVEKGIVRVSRNLNVGGKDLTRTLTETLDITEERAEVLKKSGKDFLNEPEAKIVFPALEVIIEEGNRMIATHSEKYPDRVCREIILSGGSAALTGLTQHFEKTFSRPVRKANPWGRIQYDPKHKQDIEELSTAFSVAIGLALAGIDGIRDYPHAKKKRSLKGLLSKKI
jgi:type IV pilus assembly protein PilM